MGLGGSYFSLSVYLSFPGQNGDSDFLPQKRDEAKLWCLQRGLIFLFFSVEKNSIIFITGFKLYRRLLHYAKRHWE